VNPGSGDDSASPRTREAFDLTANRGVRERYGKSPGRLQFLLARRLIEAGVRVVTLCGGLGATMARADSSTNLFQLGHARGQLHAHSASRLPGSIHALHTLWTICTSAAWPRMWSWWRAADGPVAAGGPTQRRRQLVGPRPDHWQTASRWSPAAASAWASDRRDRPSRRHARGTAYTPAELAGDAVRGAGDRPEAEPSPITRPTAVHSRRTRQDQRIAVTAISRVASLPLSRPQGTAQLLEGAEVIGHGYSR